MRILLLLVALGGGAANGVRWWAPSKEAAYFDKLFANRSTTEREPDWFWPKICAGWSAQMLCSTIFGSGIDEAVARREDVSELFAWAASSTVNYQDQSVSSTCLIDPFPPSLPYKAIWRRGVGCTLVERLTEAQIRAQDLGDQSPPAPLDPTVPWPRGEAMAREIPAGADMECIRRTTQRQFDDQPQNPRAIVVVYRQQLIFERYAPTVTKDSPLLGWSSTKSLINALIGTVVNDGLLDIYEPAPVPEWKTAGDPRADITTDELLRMSSGVQGGNDVMDIVESATCIFASNANCPGVAASKPLLHTPDTFWEYNSGSSNLLGRIALDNHGDRWNNFEWAKKKLFHRIGAHSMYIEPQANEIFLGGSSGYATARDWARMGLLFLRDGVWIDGTRHFTDWWVRYTSTASHTSAGYGAHFWMDHRTIDPGMYYMSGFRNEHVFIFPSRDLIVVRLAMPGPLVSLVWDSTAFLTEMYSCFRAHEQAANATTATA